MSLCWRKQLKAVLSQSCKVLTVAITQQMIAITHKKAPSPSPERICWQWRALIFESCRMFFHHRKICMSFHFSVQINLELLFSILFAFMEMNLCSKCIISIMTTKVSQREAYFFEALGLGETIFNKIIKLWQYCAFLDFLLSGVLERYFYIRFMGF